MSIDKVCNRIKSNFVEARNQIKGEVIKTPVRRLLWLEKIVGTQVWAKLENQQYTGSFKYRGAIYALNNHSKKRVVIAASAGNHGLAIAAASKKYNVRTNICIPVKASRLKRERILAFNAGLIEHGEGLDEAIDHAKKLAYEKSWRFISPYNDEWVITANGTIAYEFFDQVPDIKNIIVPVGGGGLASGIALAADFLGRRVKFFSCEPLIHCSMNESLKNGKPTKVLQQPTLADGLAVNLDSSSITYEIFSKFYEDPILLTEEDLAASTSLLLNHESILVEPSGAASIAALIKLTKNKKLNEPVGLILCGGNIQRSTLAKIISYPFSDSNLIKLLDMRGRVVEEIKVSKSLEKQNSKKRKHFKSSQNLHLKVLFDETMEYLNRCRKKLNDFELYCNENNLITPEDILKEQIKYLDSINEVMLSYNNRLFEENTTVADFKIEAGLRWARHAIAHINTSLEWRSASYSQSVIPQFFDLAYQESQTTNYERYEVQEVKQLESKVLDLLGFSKEKFGAIIVSSGMAAYSLIEATLLRDGSLSEHNNVLMAPYIYFEAYEQISSLPKRNVVKLESYELENIISAVKKYKPSTIFLDPLTNTVDQRMIDFVSVVGFLKSLPWKKTLVIDGTMVSGAMPETILQSSDFLEVFYYESASKYVQMGLEMSLAGFVIVSKNKEAYFDRMRRNMGTILTKQQAIAFPLVSSDLFRNRMVRISKNANQLTQAFKVDESFNGKLNVYFPGHFSHIDNEIANKLPYVGGCVTFDFADDGLNNRDLLDSYIENVIALSKKKKLAITKGVSFGYTIPRVSAASSLAENEAPFLRLFVGDISSSQLKLLTEVLINVFKLFLKKV